MAGEEIWLLFLESAREAAKNHGKKSRSATARAGSDTSGFLCTYTLRNFSVFGTHGMQHLINLVSRGFNLAE